MVKRGIAGAYPLVGALFILVGILQGFRPVSSHGVPCGSVFIGDGSAAYIAAQHGALGGLMCAQERSSHTGGVWVLLAAGITLLILGTRQGWKDHEGSSGPPV